MNVSIARKLSSVSLASAMFFAAGCFMFDSPRGVSGAGGAFDDDDDDDDGGALLATGRYFRASETSVAPMTCGITTAAGFARFDEVDVVAGAYSIEMDFDGFPFYFEITPWDGSFVDEDSPYLLDLDFADAETAALFGLGSTADCVLRCTVHYAGVVLAYDGFQLDDGLILEVASGTECTGVATSAGFAALPCEDVGHTTWWL